MAVVCLRSAIYLWSDGVADFFSCADGEAAGNDFLAESLVNVLPDFVLEALGIEAAGLYGGEAGDILSSFQRFNSHAVHMPLDFILDGFDHFSGFLLEGFPFFQRFDFGNDFGCAHCVYSFHSVQGRGREFVRDSTLLENAFPLPCWCPNCQGSYRLGLSLAVIT